MLPRSPVGDLGICGGGIGLGRCGCSTYNGQFTWSLDCDPLFAGGFGKRILRVELSRFLNAVIDPERRVDWQARRADRRGADRRRADRDELELRVFET